MMKYNPIPATMACDAQTGQPVEIHIDPGTGVATIHVQED